MNDSKRLIPRRDIALQVEGKKKKITISVEENQCSSLRLFCCIKRPQPVSFPRSELNTGQGIIRK